MGITESVPICYHHHEHKKILKIARNEIYEGTYDDKPCIYKYTSGNNIEGEILSYLQQKISNIPELYFYDKGNYMSPSGTTFTSLIVMEKIYGITLHELLNTNKNKCVPVIKNLLNIIKELHDNNVIYGDDFYYNVIINNKYEPILIDFDYSFFTHKSCPRTPSIFTFNYWKLDTCDIFRLINILEKIGCSFPNDYYLEYDINHLISCLKFTQ